MALSAGIDSRGVARDGDPAISLRQIWKSFDGGRTHAVRAVDLEIEPGAFVALIGSSGSGKTTLLKSINRLIEVDAGAIRIGGEAVEALPGYRLRRRIGYVFQSVGLFPHLSVAENIGVAPRLLGWPPPQTRARIDELMELVALPRALLTRMPAELSGGQSQRVGIARALAARPAIMLLDEPFSALDAVTRDELGTEYRRLHTSMSLTTVMATHDVMEAVLLADRIVVVRAGTIVADDTPQRLLGGHPDEGVRTLMDMPRRQAERVRELLQARGARG